MNSFWSNGNVLCDENNAIIYSEKCPCINNCSGSIFQVSGKYQLQISTRYYNDYKDSASGTYVPYGYFYTHTGHDSVVNLIAQGIGYRENNTHFIFNHINVQSCNVNLSRTDMITDPTTYQREECTIKKTGVPITSLFLDFTFNDQCKLLLSNGYVFTQFGSRSLVMYDQGFDLLDGQYFKICSGGQIYSSNPGSDKTSPGCGLSGTVVSRRC